MRLTARRYCLTERVVPFPLCALRTAPTPAPGAGRSRIRGDSAFGHKNVRHRSIAPRRYRDDNVKSVSGSCSVGAPPNRTASHLDYNVKRNPSEMSFVRRNGSAFYARVDRSCRIRGNGSTADGGRSGSASVPVAVPADGARRWATFYRLHPSAAVRPVREFFSRARARPPRDRTRDVDRIRNTPPPCPHLHLEPSDHSPSPAHLPPSPAVKMPTASRLREETWRGHMHQARTSQGCHSMLSPSSHPQSSPAQHGYSQHHLNISQPRRRRLRRRAARAAPRPPPGRAS